ncbi:hypothetical protein BKA65DRAFT_481954 [Rhexocercosporidium sp. MPI-PUGE-AT-0058]|nr:hypothetical protein BKA65DRAFT_481954 [Rhexocercosporidium sp. MPI-PUGE-AT-0058]
MVDPSTKLISSPQQSKPSLACLGLALTPQVDLAFVAEIFIPISVPVCSGGVEQQAFIFVAASTNSPFGGEQHDSLAHEAPPTDLTELLPLEALLISAKSPFFSELLRRAVPVSRAQHDSKFNERNPLQIHPKLFNISLYAAFALERWLSHGSSSDASGMEDWELEGSLFR